MDDPTIFDEAVRHLGLGSRMYRLPPDKWGQGYGHIEEWANELISSARSLNPRLPQIHFDFVLNGEVNAYAFKHRGRYFIGITTGTRYMLDLVFGRMLADSEILPFIGDPTAESEDLPLLIGYQPNGEGMYQTGIGLFKPQNTLRQAYALHLISQTLLFLIGHEIAHISRGHVDYKESRDGSGFIAELISRNLDDSEAIERQTIEMDADSRSIVSRMFSAQSSFQTEVIPPWLSEPRQPSHFMFDTLFAISCFFRLFGDKRFTSDNLKNDLYPPLPVRQGIAVANAMHFVISRWDKSLKDTAAKAFNLAVKATELSYAKILGEGLPTSGLNAGVGETGKAHWLRLLEYWDTSLKDKLKPFTYEPLD